LTIARNDYEIRYSPAENGGDETTPPEDDVFSDIMGKSLLESAGLDRKKFQARDGRVGARRKKPTANAVEGKPATPAGGADQDASRTDAAALENKNSGDEPAPGQEPPDQN
jgi:hypothetical protein